MYDRRRTSGATCPFTFGWAMYDMVSVAVPRCYVTDDDECMDIGTMTGKSSRPTINLKF
jgi:hypothetical protein